jgi:hypothetical protein
MPRERLLSGFVLRVTIKRHRWHITLYNLKTGEVKTFDSFTALSAYLESASLQYCTEPSKPS